MLVEKIRVDGWVPAIRGMRNPMESWGKSDSGWGLMEGRLGSKDLDLACRLVKAGGDHRKFMRMVIVWMDIVMPRYWWTEMDTYKVATVRNSCSTMHRLMSRLLTKDDFEPGGIVDIEALNDLISDSTRVTTVKKKNDLLIKTKKSLPESFLQRSTYMMSYETVLRIIQSRAHHRLGEWHYFCNVLLDLPHMRDFARAAGVKA